MTSLDLFVDGNKLGARFHVAHRISGVGYCLDRLHGHTYEVELRIISKGGATFIYPFESMIDILYECVSPLTNKVLLAEGGNNVVKVEDKEITYISADGKRYMFPKEDVFLMPVEEVTAEALAIYLLNEVTDRMKKGEHRTDRIGEVEIRLWEGSARGVIARKKL